MTGKAGTGLDEPVVRETCCAQSPERPLRLEMGSNSLPKTPGHHSPKAMIESICPQCHLRTFGFWDKFLGHWSSLREDNDFAHLNGLNFLLWADRWTQPSRSRMNNRDESLCNLRTFLFKSSFKVHKSREQWGERLGEKELWGWDVVEKAWDAGCVTLGPLSFTSLSPSFLFCHLAMVMLSLPWSWPQIVAGEWKENIFMLLEQGPNTENVLRQKSRSLSCTLDSALSTLSPFSGSPFL